MLKQIRNAIAAIVEAETGLTEWAGSPDGSEPMPALGYFVVTPLVLPGPGDSGMGRVKARIDFMIVLRFVAVPDPAARMGEAADKLEAVRTRLEADVVAQLARVDVGDAAFSYPPGYIEINQNVGAYALLTT